MLPLNRWMVLVSASSLFVYGQNCVIADPVVPREYIAETIVDTGLQGAIAMDLGSAGEIYVCQDGGAPGNGRIGVVIQGSPLAQPYTNIPQLYTPAGIVASAPDVWVTHQGSELGEPDQLLKYTDVNHNGRIDDTSEYETVFTDLPRGQVGTRSLFRASQERYYVGQGANSHDGSTELVSRIRMNSSVFYFDPGQEYPIHTVYAFGFYCPAGIAMSASGELFVTDRAPPGSGGEDELNLVVQGGYYGFGLYYGGDPLPPLVSFPNRSTPAGVVYSPPSEFTGGDEVLFVALEGVGLGVPGPQPRVVRVRLVRNGDSLSTEVTDFMTLLERPSGLLRVTDSFGDDALLICDRTDDRIYRVRLRREEDPPDADLNDDGAVNAADILELCRDHLTNRTDRADFYPDGKIDGWDLFLFSRGWQGE